MGNYKKDSLGDRMKMYESVPKTQLMKRTPVIIRLDGKAFHTFTRGLNKPFDKIMVNTMIDTTYELCKNIQGCVFGYTQSDEITLILQDYYRLNTDAWFDYEVQKMCSIAASMASMAFNKFFKKAMTEWWNATVDSLESEDPKNDIKYQEADKLLTTYANALNHGAMFDARVFNIPKEEVTNLIYWRQLDAQRNSVQMVGQANYSSSHLEGKSCEQIKMLLRCDFGINWDGLPTRWKRGVAWTKTAGIDYDIPILKGEDRKYVDHLIFFTEEI